MGIMRAFSRKITVDQAAAPVPTEREYQENTQTAEAQEALAARIEKISSEAMRMSGQVYELYAERVSAWVEATFPGDHPDREAAISMLEGVYLTPEELAIERQQATEMGLCCHWMDRDCCPLGCGGLE